MCCPKGLLQLSPATFLDFLNPSHLLSTFSTYLHITIHQTSLTLLRTPVIPPTADFILVWPSKTAVLRRQKRQVPDVSISQIPIIGAPLAGVVGDLSFGSVGLSNPNDIFIALGSPVCTELNFIFGFVKTFVGAFNEWSIWSATTFS